MGSIDWGVLIESAKQNRPNKPGMRGGGMANRQAMPGNMRAQAQNVADMGRYGDTELVHVNKQELRGLESVLPLTVNPHTGQKEAFWPMLVLPLLAGMLVGGFTAPEDQEGLGVLKGGLLGLSAGSLFTGIAGAAGGVAGALAPGATAAPGVTPGLQAGIAGALNPALNPAAAGAGGVFGMEIPSIVSSVGSVPEIVAPLAAEAAGLAGGPASVGMGAVGGGLNTASAVSNAMAAPPSITIPNVGPPTLSPEARGIVKPPMASMQPNPVPQGYGNPLRGTIFDAPKASVPTAETMPMMSYDSAGRTPMDIRAANSNAITQRLVNANPARGDLPPARPSSSNPLGIDPMKGPEPTLAESISNKLSRFVDKVPGSMKSHGERMLTGLEDVVQENPFKTGFVTGTLGAGIEFEPEKKKKKKTGRSILDPDDEEEKRRRQDIVEWISNRPVWADRTTRFPSSYYGPGSEEIDYFPY